MESATDTAISSAPSTSAVTVADGPVAVSSPSDAVSPADVPVADNSPIDAPSAGPSVVDVPAPAPDLETAGSSAKKPKVSLLERLRMANYKEKFNPSFPKASPFKKFHRRAYKLVKSLDAILATATKSNVVGMRLDAGIIGAALSKFALYDKKPELDEPVFVPPAKKPSFFSSSPTTPKVYHSDCSIYLLLPEPDAILFEYAFQTRDNARRFGNFCHDMAMRGLDALVRFCNIVTQKDALEQKPDSFSYWDVYLSKVADGELEHPKWVSRNNLVK